MSVDGRSFGCDEFGGVVVGMAGDEFVLGVIEDGPGGVVLLNIAWRGLGLVILPRFRERMTAGMPRTVRVYF